VQGLTRLGLTLCQAKVYLALAQIGASTVKTISRESKTPREYVYKIMPQLQEIGLVEKAVAKPAKFTAVPIRDALSILFEYRHRETLELQQKTRELANSFREHKKISGGEETEFVVVPAKEAAFKRKKLLIAAERCVDVIASRRQRLSALLCCGEESMKRLEKGVRFRVITEKRGDEDSLPKIWQELKRNPLFELRYIPTSPRAVVSVYDNKEVLFRVSVTSALEDDCLWSNNASLLAIIQEYFETMWITAMETPRYSTDEVQA